MIAPENFDEYVKLTNEHWQIRMTLAWLVQNTLSYQMLKLGHTVLTCPDGSKTKDYEIFKQAILDSDKCKMYYDRLSIIHKRMVEIHSV